MIPIDLEDAKDFDDAIGLERAENGHWRLRGHIADVSRYVKPGTERDSKDVKLYAFLKTQLKSGRPQPYPALVTDVRNFGFFVDVPGLAMSGLVPLSTVEDDFFVFDVARNLLVGRRTRRIIRLGDNVTVQVAKVDSFKKQVDFRLAPVARSRPARTPSHNRAPQVRSTHRPDRTRRGPKPPSHPKPAAR